MAMMNIGSMVNKATPTTTVTAVNTGTLFDLMTGTFTPGKDGKMYLKGGLGTFITGLHGKGNTYKSTILDSFIMGCLRIYKDAQVIIADTEGSKCPNRIATFTKDALHSGVDIEGRLDVRPRMHMTDDIPSLNEVWGMIRGLCEEREKNKKTQQITLPYIDKMTGEYAKAWIPIFFYIDSFTELCSEIEDDMLESNKGLEDGKNNTVWMVDGNKKTLLIRSMRKKAEEYGICFVCSAHTGVNIAMGNNANPTKQLQMMKQADKIKGCGSKFEFLTHILCQTLSPKFCHDSSKSALFPMGPTPDNDLNEIPLMIQRNKTNASGFVTPLVISQAEGLLNDVTNLNFLRANGYVGLDGGPSAKAHACVWLPDNKFSRKNFRTKADTDYALARAIELMAQFRYIQLNWNKAQIPPIFSESPEAVYEKMKASDLDLDKVMQSTGTWNYEKTDREYMSIMDIMAAL